MKQEHTFTLGDRIKEIRRELRLSQKTFAQALEISSSYMSEIESGKKNPGFEVLNRLTDKYNVNLSYLFTGEGDFFIQHQKEKIIEIKKKKLDFNGADQLIEEMLWYMEHVPVVKYAVIEFFKSYLFEKRAMIQEELEEYEQKVHKETVAR